MATSFFALAARAGSIAADWRRGRLCGIFTRIAPAMARLGRGA